MTAADDVGFTTLRISKETLLQIHSEKLKFCAKLVTKIHDIADRVKEKRISYLKAIVEMEE